MPPSNKPLTEPMLDQFNVDISRRPLAHDELRSFEWPIQNQIAPKILEDKLYTANVLKIYHVYVMTYHLLAFRKPSLTELEYSLYMLEENVAAWNLVGTSCKIDKINDITHPLSLIFHK